MKKIHVNKAFVFNTAEGARAFAVGHHEIDDAIAAHSWIASGADGHISADADVHVEPEAPAEPEPKSRKGR